MDFRIQGVIELQDRVGRGVASATSSLAQLNEVVLQQWWGLDNIAKSFAMIGGAVTAGVGIAIREAVLWEEAMADVQRTVASFENYDWENALNLEEIERGIRDIAAVTPLAAHAIAGIASEAGALGIAQEGIVEFTKVVADLAAVTDLTEQEAANMFARVASLTGLPTDQFENLGSAILEVGRSTASTETEISAFSTRLAAFLAPLGFSADQVVALSAAMASLGIRAERGSTAIQKTMFDMQAAITEGGDELANFARVSGQSVEEFTQTFQNAPQDALTNFVEGLDNITRSGADTAGVLANLGIIEVRQVNTLLALAQASQNVVAPHTQLRNVFAQSAEAFQENNAISAITAERYATLAAQAQILRNRFSELADGFGKSFMPLLRAVNIALTAFADGMEAIGPIGRGLFLGLTIIAGIIATLTAALFMIVPRLVLMRHSIVSLTAANMGAAASFDRLAVASGNMAVSVTAASAAATGAANSANMTAASNLALGGSMAAAVGPAAKLVGWLGRVSKALGVIGAVLSLGTVAVTIWGAVVGRSTDEVENATRTNMALLAVMRQQESAVGDAVNAWLADQLVLNGVNTAAQRAGVSMATLVGLITSPGGDNPAWNAMADQLRSIGDEGEEALAIVMALRQEWAATGTTYQQTIEFNNEAADSYEDLTGNMDKAAAAARREREALDERNQALLAYGDAVLSARRAQFALNDAREDYEESLANAKDPSGLIAEAEWDVEKARHAVASATRDLRKAEADLGTARQRGREELREAQLDLADANHRYEDSLEKIREAEEHLAQLRRGPTLNDLRDATIRLEKAQVSLLRNNQKLADAEWYLNYLRQEGASNRDIADAELALQAAQADVLESEDELIDSTENLADVRAGASAEEMAKAERDLERAYLNSERAARRVTEEERDLAAIRKAVAEDQYYKNALREVEEASWRVRDANMSLQDAQLELQGILDGDLWYEVAKAELAYEEALYNAAKANVEVKRQTALMNGEFYSAGHAAQDLAAELNRLGAEAPANIQNNLNKISSVLRRGIPQMRDDIEDGLDSLTGGDGLGTSVGREVGGNLFDGIMDSVQEQADDRSWWQRLGDALMENAPEVLSGIGGIIGGLVGVKIGGGIGAALGSFAGPVGTAVGAALGALIGWVVGWLIQRFGPAIMDFFREWGPRVKNNVVDFFSRAFDWDNFTDATSDMVSGMRGWFRDDILWPWEGEFWTEMWQTMKDFGYDIIEGLLKGMGSSPRRLIDGWNILWDKFISWVKQKLGISSPSTVFAGFGADLIAGLVQGLTNNTFKVLNWAINLPGRIISSIGDLASRTKGKGSDIVSGIWNGMHGKWQSFKAEWLTPLGSYVFGAIGNIMGSVKGKGIDIINGIWNGVYERYNQIKGWFQNVGDWIKEKIGGVFKFGSPSKLTTQWGRWLIEGLALGIQKERSNLLRELGATLSAMNPDDFASMASQFQASVPSYNPTTGAASATAGTPSTTRGGDTINVKAETNADPFAIANEIVWAKRVRLRR